MEYNISLTKNECEIILNALRQLESENLSKSLIAVENMRYKNVKQLYTDEKTFIKDMEQKKKIINEEMKAIEQISEKIENEMY